ncbi:DUF1028 domain-containing protein [Stenotrophomonas sp. CD2]|nr:DUF1028 domain-containing protein [Stenotrophomonas sp. CD2]
MFLLRSCLVLLLAAFAAPAWATFSIAACNAAGDCGVAVATHNLAVGGVGVPWAQAKVGAVASQFETNPTYGSKGLELMAKGRTPAQVLKQLLDEDGNFDGTTLAERQVGLVSARDGNAQYTGATAQQADWAGAQGEGMLSVQGNGLAGPEVLASMQRVFAASQGELAARLLAALEAGRQQAGSAVDNGRRRCWYARPAATGRTPTCAWTLTHARSQGCASCTTCACPTRRSSAPSSAGRKAMWQGRVQHWRPRCRWPMAGTVPGARCAPGHAAGRYGAGARVSGRTACAQSGLGEAGAGVAVVCAVAG